MIMKKLYKYLFAIVAILGFGFLIFFGFEMFTMSGERTTITKIAKVNKNK